MWAGRAHFYLHDHEIAQSPPDESFIDMLKQSCCLSGPHFPPPAILEVLQDYVTNYHKVRRLHLIVVDLWRPWKYNTARAKQITDQLWHIQDCDNTRRVSPFRPDGPEPPLRRRRFAYGYALDGSEFPCYLVWPQRDGRSYVLLDTATNDTLVLDQSFFRPLGMQHFYDSFAHLAKEVAAILQAILMHPTKKLYDDRTAHLLCSNYWAQPSIRNCCIRLVISVPPLRRCRSFQDLTSYIVL